MYEGEILKRVLFFLFYFWMENFKSTFQQIAAVGIAEPIYNQIEFFSVKKKKTLWIWKEVLCSLPAPSYFSITLLTPVVPAIMFFRSITSVGTDIFKNTSPFLIISEHQIFLIFVFPFQSTLQV